MKWRSVRGTVPSMAAHFAHGAAKVQPLSLSAGALLQQAVQYYQT